MTISPGGVLSCVVFHGILLTLSLVLTQTSARALSSTVGMKSYPIPSTFQRSFYGGDVQGRGTQSAAV